MVIEVAIRMAEAELKTLEAQYDQINHERYLALKFKGKKSELAELKRQEEIAWARYDQLSTFLINLKYEYERVGAQALPEEGQENEKSTRRITLDYRAITNRDGIVGRRARPAIGLHAWRGACWADVLCDC